VIVHGGDRAYYRPRDDRIQLPPPEQFRSSEGY
jgi:antirestriction protein ArdC